MCGLVGVAGNIHTAHERAMELLLVFDSIRGPHSTGVLSVPPFAKENLVKKVGSPWELFDDKLYDECMFGAHRVLIGHNRFATTGAINSANAHPFMFDNIMGAHNGTLRDQTLLDDYEEYEVDSENIFHHMNKNGVEDTIGKLNGAYALVWWNSQEESLNFIRNHERPLFWCKAKHTQTVFWASEEWMLNVALSKNKIAHEPVESFPINKHHCLKINKGNNAHPLGGVSVIPMEGYKQPAYERYQAKKSYQRGNSFNASSAGIGEAAEYCGKDMLVSVVGAGRDANTKQEFIEFGTTNKAFDDVELRAYILPDSDMGEELLTSGKCYIVTLGRARFFQGHKRNSYIKIKPGSIAESAFQFKEKEEEEPTIKDYAFIGDDFRTCVSQDEWLEYIENSSGCSWCLEKPKWESHNEIEWISDKEYMCVDCVDARSDTGNVVKLEDKRGVH